ncbi:MAG: alpha/beta hydrolase [Actinomycetota bacterium]|nr:alpha/beta hydrolase [Actinomycetota bacterium]
MNRAAHQPRSHTFDAGTVELHYLEYGDPSAPPVVILHGHTDCAWSWHQVSVELAETRRVIAVDLRGHGESGSGSYTATHLVGDLRAVIERAELERPAIVAHSLGGHVASHFGGAFPDEPERLALVEAIGPPRAAFTTDSQWRDMFRQRVDVARELVHRRPMRDLAEACERFGRSHPTLTGEQLELVVGHLVRPANSGNEGNGLGDGDGAVEWKFDPLSRDWIATHDPDRIEVMWRGITCPVLHVLGADAHELFWSRTLPNVPGLEDGPIRQEELDRRMACFADHRLVVLEECGHMPHYEQPTALIEALKTFLA